MILEYRGEQLQTVEEPLRTREGELVIPVWDSRNRRFEYLWADTEGGEMRSLAREDVSSQSIFQMYEMQGNDFYYYNANKEIVRWNIESGERTKILDLPKNGLVAGLNILMALGGEGDQPVLCLADLVKTRDHGINPTADSVSEAANLNRGMYLWKIDVQL